MARFSAPVGQFVGELMVMACAAGGAAKTGVETAPVEGGAGVGAGAGAGDAGARVATVAGPDANDGASEALRAGVGPGSTAATFAAAGIALLLAGLAATSVGEGVR